MKTKTVQLLVTIEVPDVHKEHDIRNYYTKINGIYDFKHNVTNIALLPEVSIREKKLTDALKYAIKELKEWNSESECANELEEILDSQKEK